GAARRQTARRDVDLQVEPAEFGRPRRIRDRLQGAAVAHHRLRPLVAQSQLDLQPDLRALGLAPCLAQHQREAVEALLYLDPVPPAVLAGDHHRRDVPSHRSSLPARALGVAQPPAWHHRATPTTRRCPCRVQPPPPDRRHNRRARPPRPPGRGTARHEKGHTWREEPRSASAWTRNWWWR